MAESERAAMEEDSSSDGVDLRPQQQNAPPLAAFSSISAPSTCTCGERAEAPTALVCEGCARFVHPQCLPRNEQEMPLPGDLSYLYRCPTCNTETPGEHLLRRYGKSWAETGHVALWNLIQDARRKGVTGRVGIRFKEELCPFIEAHWTRLCTGKLRTGTWSNSLQKELPSHPQLFVSLASDLGAGQWTLRSEDVPAVLGDRKRKDSKKKKRAEEPLSASSASPASSATSRKKKPSAAPAHSVPIPDEVLIPIHSGPYTPDMHQPLCVARRNSAPQLLFAEDGAVANTAGYRMARTSHGVNDGAWYCEIEILPPLKDVPPDTEPHVRLGWATARAELQAPVGFDVFGYAWRDSPSSLFHASRLIRAYGDSFSPGDVIGLWISLIGPPSSTADETLLADPKKAKTPSTDADKSMGSRIAFYKNGKSQGDAFTDLYQGTYYPAASMYMGASVRFHMSPPWRAPPSEGLPKGTKPIADRVETIRRALAEERAREEEARKAAQPPPPAAAAATPSPALASNANVSSPASSFFSASTAAVAPPQTPSSSIAPPSSSATASTESSAAVPTPMQVDS